MSKGDGDGKAVGGALVNINLDLKHASKAVIKLIDAISRGLGLLYEPAHVRRTAAAYRDASALVDADPAAKSLQERSVCRLLGQEVRAQRNIESISAKALDMMPSEADDTPVDEDLVASFFDMCRNVSDEDMQILWARLLAGEVASPGTYSRRTLDTIRTLSKEEAEAFALYCRYVCKDSDGFGMCIQDHEADTYLCEKVGLHAGYRSHFADIGLVSVDVSPLPTDDDTPLACPALVYFDRSVLIVKETTEDHLPHVFAIESLTATGTELHSISGATPDYEYFDILVASLRELGLVKQERQANGTIDGDEE